MNKEQFEHLCLELRRKILKINIKSGSGHLTSSFSLVEIMVALYFADVMRYNPKNPADSKRDYFVLSKGHAALALYAILNDVGYIKEQDLWSVCGKGSSLGGHPSIRNPGVETTSGSLGHGLSLATGIALGLKIKGLNNRVYCITGDGELQEGSNWEAAMSISHLKLKNLTWIIDNNKIQLSGYTDKVMSLGNLRNKIESFGFDVIEINGHDYNEIMDAFAMITERPKVILANTKKGYGANLCMDKLGWHGRKPSNEELKELLLELKMTEENFL